MCLWISAGASLVAQVVKNLPAMQETQIQSLGREDPLEEGVATHSNILAWRITKDRRAWWVTVHGVTKSQTWLSMRIHGWIPAFLATYKGDKNNFFALVILLLGINSTEIKALIRKYTEKLLQQSYYTMIHIHCWILCSNKSLRHEVRVFPEKSHHIQRLNQNTSRA